MVTCCVGPFDEPSQWNRGVVDGLQSMLTEVVSRFDSVLTGHHTLTGNPTEVAVRAAEGVLRKQVVIELPEVRPDDPDDFVNSGLAWIAKHHPPLGHQSDAFKLWYVFERWLLFVHERTLSKAEMEWLDSSSEMEDVYRNRMLDLATRYCQPGSGLLADDDFNTNVYKTGYTSVLPNAEWLAILGVSSARWSAFAYNVKVTLDMNGKEVKHSAFMKVPEKYIPALRIEPSELESLLSGGPKRARLMVSENSVFPSVLGTGKFEYNFNVIW